MTRSDLFARTVGNLAGKARWFLLAEQTPDRDGFLQAVAPSVKLVGLVALVALAATRDALAAAAALGGLAWLLALASRVPARAFFGRVSAPPAFAFLVVAPQAVLMDGPALGGTPFSEPGVSYVVLFVVRVAACVGFLSLVLLTTRFTDLLAGLRRLRAPGVAVTLLAITYRYLLVFFAELERMVRARESRTIRARGIRKTWRDSGNFTGTFLLRSIERGERVQRAARARGGTQLTHYDRTQSLGRADAAFAALVAVAVVAVVL
ncbi:cobalt ECF transporter T component CbiQ [Halorientalis brevis]|uniref:Cobalt ECF transporter T component CbiQ n=1 Tax=Halorientalis brevis TaxID=1126241 RepID=A0ABD6C5B5_9EURY|nr:cobalt ECF transporter T component CbiQ [Halorientalis brevis]